MVHLTHHTKIESGKRDHAACACCASRRSCATSAKIEVLCPEGAACPVAGAVAGVVADAVAAALAAETAARAVAALCSAREAVAPSFFLNLLL